MLYSDYTYYIIWNMEEVYFIFHACCYFVICFSYLLICTQPRCTTDLFRTSSFIVLLLVTYHNNKYKIVYTIIKFYSIIVSSAAIQSRYLANPIVSCSDVFILYGMTDGRESSCRFILIPLLCLALACFIVKRGL
jgi:hypothetical protein